MEEKKTLSPLVGLGYRNPLSAWIDTKPAAVECLELTADHFSEHDTGRIKQLGRDYPLLVHALRCSVGTPGPLDAEELRKLEEIVRAARPLWVSDHLGFVRTEEVDLGHFCPLIPSSNNVAIVADHVCELSERLGVPILLENATSHVNVIGPMAETEFINRICEQSDCGLLLDVTNLYVNSRNHRFGPVDWLHNLEPAIIRQLHVVGCKKTDDLYFDSHDQPIGSPLWDLIREVADYAPVEAVTLERDSNFPPPEQLIRELEQLKNNFSTTRSP